ncbi:MAG: ABC transporter substrate-binding protein [Chloroflexi bacterium]|nr:ABC transporter substrate-binding protein [Chloroflexota bacterium]
MLRRSWLRVVSTAALAAVAIACSGSPPAAPSANTPAPPSPATAPAPVASPASAPASASPAVKPAPAASPASVASPTAGATSAATGPIEVKPTGAATKLRIAQGGHGFLWTAMYLARGAGHFAEEGLDVEVSILAGGGAATQALAAGAVEIAPLLLSDVTTAAGQGRPLITIAGLLDQIAINVVLRKDVAARKGITETSTREAKVAALKGLKMGITTPGTGTDDLIRYLLKTGQIDAEREVDIVPLNSQPNIIAAFKQGQIDGFLNSSPTSDSAVFDGTGIMLFNSTKGEIPELRGLQYQVVATTRDYAGKNADTVQRFVRAVAKSQKLLRDDRLRARETMKRFFDQMDPKLFDLAYDNNYDGLMKSPVVTSAGYQKLVDFTQSVKTGITLPPFDRVVVNTFAEKAKSDVGN